MTKITVTARRSSVYVKAHHTAEVLLTPRVQQLLDAGELVLVDERTDYADPTAGATSPVEEPESAENTGSESLGEAIESGPVVDTSPEAPQATSDGEGEVRDV